jgi:tRNA threonylcarbamoyladenosine biosynthesis protein TsaE
MIHTSHSLVDTNHLAELFVSYLRFNPTTSNIFGFSGDLGSGKTAFTKCVAELLGISEHVTSPTFVIEKRYPVDQSVVGKGFPFKILIHIDAYRLENADELTTIGFEEDVEDQSKLILVEWPERVIEVLPSTTPIIRFSFISEHVRTIEFPDMMGI